MAKMRKFCAYRRLDARPYTRKSKFRKKSYIRASPNSKVVRYVMGNKQQVYPLTMTLCSKGALQIRHNAIESARLTANRLLEKELGKDAYRLTIRIFPHHILRENALASGAGADRLSTGMKASFGKAVGIAARVKKGQALFTLELHKEKMALGRKALHKVGYKIPCSTYIIEE